MFVSKINVTKGKSVERAKNRWEKAEFSIEISLNEGDNPELAKIMSDTLLDSWLREGESPQKTVQKTAKSDKKICAYSGCSKEIDPKYRYCYTHFQKIRSKN